MKEKKPKSIIKTIIKINFLLLLLLLSVGMLYFYNKYGKDILAMHDEAKKIVISSSKEDFRETETSLVYDKNGNLLSVLKGAKDVYYISYDDIPEYAVDAMIAMEDKNFKSHPGFDTKGILRALKSYMDNKGEVTQGASTITQQLSRNIFLSFEVTWERKVKEIFIAMELEKKYTKAQIMEFYLNNINFANGYYGIQAASKGYFNKEVKELSLSQIAFLCAIPNSPTRYDPVERIENTLGRRDRMLAQMLAEGKITSREYEEAIEEKIKLKLTKTDKNNYVETYVYYCATRALMKQQGFNFQYVFESEKEKERYNDKYSEIYKQCLQSLYTSGYRIYTSIEPKKQKLLQKSVDSSLSKFKEVNDEGIYTLQGSATCIDNTTGRVVAIVGGRHQNTSGYTLNRAYQSYRQPGSAIKPLIVYAPAFDLSYSPEENIIDEEIENGPSNADGRYLGSMTIRRAVELSRNTTAWKIFEELTPRVGISYIKSMGFGKIVADDYVPAASIGGFTYGVTSVEMAAGYATLENDGEYREPTCIIKITDARGNEIVKGKPNKKNIYGLNAARIMTDVLTGVIKYGTARGKGLEIPGISTAGKTGTTNNKKDGWFVGYTPYYTTAVWVGYDMPKTLNDLTGGSYPAEIWGKFMKEIHMKLEPMEFLPYIDLFKPQEEIEEETEVEITEPIIEEPTEKPTKKKNNKYDDYPTDNSFIDIDELEDADLDYFEEWENGIYDVDEFDDYEDNLDEYNLDNNIDYDITEPIIDDELSSDEWEDE